MAEGAERLGLVLAVLVNALDPGAVVVGGGLGLHDGYRARVERALRAAVYDDAVRGLPVRAGAPWAPTRPSSARRSPQPPPADPAPCGP